jgi:aryl-alcohol dehydrogenase-like predicted oxidoreductase
MAHLYGPAARCKPKVMIWRGWSRASVSGPLMERLSSWPSWISARVRSHSRLSERGLNILKALDVVAAEHQARPAEIALAWLMAREGVTAPIASATSIAQIENFAKAANLSLTADDIATLDKASL